MPIQISCDACGFTKALPDSSAGKRGKCPKCGAPLIVPGLAPAPPPPPPTPPPEPPLRMTPDAFVDWPAQVERLVGKLDAIEAHAKKTERYSKATSQYTGCLVLVFVLLPILSMLLWFFVLAAAVSQ